MAQNGFRVLGALQGFLYGLLQGTTVTRKVNFLVGFYDDSDIVSGMGLRMTITATILIMKALIGALIIPFKGTLF